MHTQTLSISVEEVVQPMPWLIPAAFTTLLNVLPEAYHKRRCRNRSPRPMTRLHDSFALSRFSIRHTATRKRVGCSPGIVHIPRRSTVTSWCKAKDSSTATRWDTHLGRRSMHWPLHVVFGVDLLRGPAWLIHEACTAIYYNCMCNPLELI